MEKHRRLLAVFAHPDDEAYGPAATLAKYAREGVAVSLFCATHGESGLDSGVLAHSDAQSLKQVRAAELTCSAQALGIDHLTLCDFGDGQLDRIDPTALIGAMVRTLRSERPHVVITFGPDGLTGHRDHIAVSHCCTAAFHLAPDASQYPEHFYQGLRPHQPHKLYYYTVPERVIMALDLDLIGSPSERITAEIDVEPFVDMRLDAIRCHQSQRDAAMTVPRSVPTTTKALLRRQNTFVLASPTPLPGTYETCLFQGLTSDRPSS